MKMRQAPFFHITLCMYMGTRKRERERFEYVRKGEWKHKVKNTKNLKKNIAVHMQLVDFTLGFILFHQFYVFFASSFPES